MTGSTHHRLIEEFENRAEEHQEKAEEYDGEKSAWFRGLATGYRGAVEEMQEGNDE